MNKLFPISKDLRCKIISLEKGNDRLVKIHLHQKDSYCFFFGLQPFFM